MVGIIILKTCGAILAAIFTLSTSCSRPVNNVHTQAIEEPDKIKDSQILTDSATSSENTGNDSEAIKIQADHLREDPDTFVDGSDNVDALKDENVCKGYIKTVEKDGFSVRVTMCSDRIKEYTFKYIVAEVIPNPKHPLIAIYLSDYDQHPESEELVYAVQLLIINVRNNKEHKFKLDGYQHFGFNLWSQDGDYAAFADMGRGIEIVKTTQLERYLTTHKGAYRFVITDRHYKNRSWDEHPAEIIKVIGWRSNTVLIVSHGCCGHIWETDYNTVLNTYKKTACHYGYCMSTRSTHFETNQDDFIIKNGTATMYQLSNTMKRYFYHLDKHCSSLVDWNTSPKTAGYFFLNFKLNKAGKAVDPVITQMKTASPLANEQSFRNCILDHAEELSFPPSEINGTETISVRISIVASR